MGSISLTSGDDGESHINEIDPARHPNWKALYELNGTFAAWLRWAGFRRG